MGDAYVRVIPPPPPTAMVVVGAVAAFLAAAAGFLGYGLAAGILATISGVADIAYLVQIRGQYWVPKEALDADGKLRTGKIDMSGKSEKL